MKNFYLSIPSKPFIKKYIYKRYGYPVQVDNGTLIGVAISSILEKKVHDNNPVDDRENRFSSLTDKIELVIPAYKVYSYEQGLNISIKKAIVLNRYFEIQFVEDLYRHCMQHTKPDLRNLTRKGFGGCGYDKAILQFAQMHDLEIDVDITFEALKKNEYRYRKKMESLSCGNVLSVETKLQTSIFN